VNDSFGFLCEEPGGREVGFKVLGYSEFDPEATDVTEIWEGSRFNVPVLGLPSASAGEIVLAARALFGTASSINRKFFDAATSVEGTEALALWLACLQSGDAMAHFGLGYTLHELGRYSEAYRHLRHYTEIAPCGSWNWCWFGKAARDIGEIAEARRAFDRAIELERQGDQPTDAAELLAELEDRNGG
jgi:tetratricopeptide (TPR) repeat protein